MAARTVVPGAGAGVLRPWPNRLPGRRAAHRTAEALESIVEGELEYLRALPIHLRTRPAEVLAQLATLATDHRHRARGWIGRDELRRCIARALAEIDRVAAESPRKGRP